MKQLAIVFAFVLFSLNSQAEEVAQVVPPEKFQGVWVVKSSSMTALEAGQDHGEWKEKGEKVQIYFREHETGAIQKIQKDKKGEVLVSRGITILSLTENTLRFRLWSDHEGCYTEVIVNADGSRTLNAKSPKHMLNAELEALEK